MKQPPKRLVECPCGADAVWYKTPPRPEDAPEHAVCLLTDDEFADNYCEECFPQAVPPAERGAWKRIDAENEEAE